MKKTSVKKLASILLLLSIGMCSCSKAPAETSTPTEPSEVSNELEQKTIDSLSEVADGIYEMDFYSDYKLDEYLAANITDIVGMDTWLTENLTHGVPTGDIPEFGCSSFAIEGDNGDHLFGRNYDMKNGDSLVVRTAPENGYASVGIVDLMHINLGGDGDYAMDDETGKSLLLAAPWGISDGTNEKGLGVSILELSISHETKDTSKDDLLLYAALRVILDKCATIDEAVDLLSNYDVYSSRSSAFYHLFLTDTSGRSVIVEWDDDNEQIVVEDTAVANFELYQGDLNKDYDRRYSKIHKKIDEVDSMTSEEAMGVLKFAKQSGTHWSAVYDLEKFSVDVCFNIDYDHTYSFEGKMSPL